MSVHITDFTPHGNLFRLRNVDINGVSKRLRLASFISKRLKQTGLSAMICDRLRYMVFRCQQ